MGYFEDLGKKDTGLLGAAGDDLSAIGKVAGGAANALGQAAGAIGQSGGAALQAVTDKVIDPLAQGATKVLGGDTQTPLSLGAGIDKLAAPKAAVAAPVVPPVSPPIAPPVPIIPPTVVAAPSVPPPAPIVAPPPPEEPKALNSQELAGLQSDIHGTVTAAAKANPDVLDQPAQLRAATDTNLINAQNAAGASAPVDAATAKTEAVNQNVASGIIPATAADQDKNAMQQYVDDAHQLEAEYKKSADQANATAQALANGLQASPEMQQLAEVNLKMAGSKEEIRKALIGYGGSSADVFAQQLYDQQNSALIAQKQYLTTMLDLKDKAYDRALKVSEDAATRAANSFDKAFDLEGKVLDWKQMAASRQDALEQRQEVQAQSRADHAVTSGSLAYMSDSELSDLSQNSGYSVGALQSMRDAAKGKATADQRKAAIDDARLKLDQQKVNDELNKPVTDANKDLKDYLYGEIKKYQDAGITLDDTISSAAEKIKKSPTYIAEQDKAAADLRKAQGLTSDPANDAVVRSNIHTVKGQDFISLADFPDKDSKVSAMTYAAANNIPIVNQAEGEKLVSISNTYDNVDKIASDMQGLLAENQGENITKGLGNSVKDFFGDEKLRSFKTWRVAIINNVQALAGGSGSGLRINQAEIDTALNNDLPVLEGSNADTLASAQAKLNNLTNQLDTWRNTLINKKGTSGTNGSPAPATNLPSGPPPSGQIWILRNGQPGSVQPEEFDAKTDVKL